ncbi:DUF3883 domain-containing protein [Desulfococcaceae bacterium HSG7]|nr:DUF3883 domain-containing protein [Desulfococcaceae bacterium HSG7]
MKVANSPVNMNSVLRLGKVNIHNIEKTTRDQQKRGIGLERKLALESAITVKSEGLMKECIDEIKTAIEQNDKDLFDREENKKIIEKYKKGLDTIIPKLYSKVDVEALSKYLHVSKKIGDGLGYDILFPEISNDQAITILKVEVKSSKSGDKIFLSENERKRILHFKNYEPNWRLWLNSSEGDMTEDILDAVWEHNENHFFDQRVHANGWEINLEDPNVPKQME